MPSLSSQPSARCALSWGVVLPGRSYQDDPTWTILPGRAVLELNFPSHTLPAVLVPCAVLSPPRPSAATPFQFGPRMRAVSRTVQSYWSAFTTTADPNGELHTPAERHPDSSDSVAKEDGNPLSSANSASPSPSERNADPLLVRGRPFWPRHRASGGDGERTLLLAEAPAVEEGYLAGKCDFWDRLCADTDCFGPGARIIRGE